MLTIRQANIKDKNSVLKFYEELIDQIKDNKYTPQWENGVYPKKENIIKSIKSNEMYIGEKDSKLVCAMVLDHNANKGYENIQWLTDVDFNDVYVIHLLAVKPEYNHQGFAKQLLNFAFDKAKNEGMKSIRLSIMKDNVPAERLYQKKGFEYVGSMEVYDEDRGLKCFNVGEKII